jgi:pyrroloquinoline-quinone synthase
MILLQQLLPKNALIRLDQTTFLSRCRTGTVSRQELETFLVQHFHYARHFTRYLCALLANLSEEQDRRDLTVNLFEEMGLGHIASEPHSKIYRDMLTAFGLDPNGVDPLPETETLIRTMLQYCKAQDPIAGLAALCLGAEAIVPHVYSQILTGLRSQGFPEEHLRFFVMHIEGDDDHALTMAKIITRELNRRPELKSRLNFVADDAIETRAKFFNAISVASALYPSTSEVAHAL